MVSHKRWPVSFFHYGTYSDKIFVVFSSAKPAFSDDCISDEHVAQVSYQLSLNIKSFSRIDTISEYSSITEYLSALKK